MIARVMGADRGEGAEALDEIAERAETDDEDVGHGEDGFPLPLRPHLSRRQAGARPSPSPVQLSPVQLSWARDLINSKTRLRTCGSVMR
jgi:hypothetical protein